MKVLILSIVIFQRRRTGSRGPSLSTPGCVHVQPPVRDDDDDDTMNSPSRTTTAAAAAAAASTLRTRRRTLRRTWRRTWPSGPGRRAPSSPRHHRRRRRRLCAARAEMGSQLGSSVAFGSGCRQALPGVPRKALLCLLMKMLRIPPSPSVVGVKSSQDLYPQMTCKLNAHNRAPLM